MSRTLTKSLSPALNSKVARYSLGAVAGAISVASSNAAIVYVNAGNAILDDDLANDSLSTYHPIDLNGDAVVDFRLRTRADEGVGSLAYVAAATDPGASVGVLGAPVGNYNYAARLSAGAMIDGSAVFLNVTEERSNFASMAFRSGYSNSQWAYPGANSGYLGIRFNIAGEQHFAWVRLTVALDTDPRPRAFTLHEFAYESTPGTGIAAGDGVVPEPTSLGLLALGSIGLTAHRRRRPTTAG